MLNRGEDNAIFELIKQVVRINTAKVVVFASIFYIASAFIIYYIEPETFGNPFNGLWWVLTTVTTVGFGDYSPVTVPGRIYGMFLFLFGIGLIGIILGKIVDSFTYYGRLKMEGKLNYTGKNHFLVIGWSKNVEKTIVELLLNRGIEKDVVLIDGLKESPFKHERFHYIQGNPTETKILQQANIDEAESVAVFASDYEYEVQADGKTLLIASAVERYAAEKGIEIYTIAEITHRDHIRMFKHADVDEFVLSSESFPQLMTKSLMHHGASRLYMQLLNHAYGENIWEIEPKSSWKTYGDAFKELTRLGANLIAEGHDLSIVRRLDDPIPEGARLYVICDQQTYEKLTLIG
ncbi:ion channel [Planomicrobium okeanokoites]|uniref:ion channel n=1 Tax=Planomicrobium okeanokoites TaxID=244 RepID=UPI000A004E6A|nr:ion channel [Planomicrobium okeanokoites]